MLNSKNSKVHFVGDTFAAPSVVFLTVAFLVCCLLTMLVAPNAVFAQAVSEVGMVIFLVRFFRLLGIISPQVGQVRFLMVPRLNLRLSVRPEMQPCYPVRL